MTIRMLFGSGLLAIAGAAQADLSEQLRDCANIFDSNTRLACFDGVTDALNKGTLAPHAAPVAEAKSAGGSPAAVTTSAAADDDDRPMFDEGDFGFETQRIEDGIPSIETRYAGEFSGWSGQTLFRLENGQVWKQAQSGRVSYRADRPLITIRRGALGSFRLSVDGINKTIRVVRIK